jgi:hypothetical protein
MNVALTPGDVAAHEAAEAAEMARCVALAKQSDAGGATQSPALGKNADFASVRMRILRPPPSRAGTVPEDLTVLPSWSRRKPFGTGSYARQVVPFCGGVAYSAVCGAVARAFGRSAKV